MGADFIGRPCPICGRAGGDGAVFLKENFNQAAVTATSYASRKEPEFMNYELRRCPGCATVFAPRVPQADAIIHAYHQADYDSAVEAGQAAATYARALRPHLAGLGRGAALEIGTGSGAFLGHLRDEGFARIVGVEPSRAAIDAALPGIRPLIREGIFSDGDYPPDSFDLICCFMTFEHVPEPLALMRAFNRVLAPGGKIALVVHDYRAPINRLLGRRSPIIDIEHLQIYCRRSVETLFAAAGLEAMTVEPLTNAYRLAYWLRLLPLPPKGRRAVIAAAAALGLAERVVSVNVGNMLCVATKQSAKAVAS